MSDTAYLILTAFGSVFVGLMIGLSFQETVIIITQQSLKPPPSLPGQKTLSDVTLPFEAGPIHKN
jgi:hypothetical protein